MVCSDVEETEVCFVSQVSLALNGGPRWLTDMMWVSAEDGKSNCAMYSKGENVFFRPTNVFCQASVPESLNRESKTL